MKVKHLLLSIITLYMIYLDIYAITHFKEVFNDGDLKDFELIAGTSLIVSCVCLLFFILFYISTYIDQIKDFLNKKIL
jgi:hypothetical protein